MVDYCTVRQVLDVAITFRADVDMSKESGDDTVSFLQNSNTIWDGDVEKIITEASEMVRGKLKPRYSIAVIDAYDPYPPVVVYYTKIYAAILMYERFANQSVERNNLLIGTLQRSIKEYQTIIVNGSLVDASGVAVPTVTNPVLLAGADNEDFTAAGELQELYEDGRVY